MSAEEPISSLADLLAAKGRPRRGRVTGVRGTAARAQAESREAPPPPQAGLLFDFDAAAEPEQAMPRSSSTAPVPARFSPIVLPPREQPAVREAAVPAPPPAPRQAIVYTVRGLLNEIRLQLERAYTGLLAVEGEISNCRPAGSGHLYFTLKDGDAQLAIVMFRRETGLLGFKPRDGLQVELRGRIAVYETRGQLQMIAETMRPRGEGALQLAFEQLKRRLAAEGLFDVARKRPLPSFPHCIGVVTSTSGAALRDIIQVVRRRHARLNLLVYPAVVQGPGCPGSVAVGVRWFNRHPERVDLILVARGGGSYEDLAGFNDEALARAIAGSALPVVSAIGHEIDTTIADLAADLRAPTPSAAAELITAAQHRIEERVAALERRVRRAGQYQLMHARQRFGRLSAGYVLARLRDSIALRQQRVDELRFRLSAALTAREHRRQRMQSARLAALETRLRRCDPGARVAAASRRLGVVADRLDRLAVELTSRRRGRLDRAAGRLNALSPLAVLHRGYAIVYTESGAILRDAAEVRQSEPIRARLARGSVRARVLELEIETTETTNP